MLTTATHGSSSGKVHSLLEGLGEAKAKTFYDDSRCVCVCLNQIKHSSLTLQAYNISLRIFSAKLLSLFNMREVEEKTLRRVSFWVARSQHDNAISFCFSRARCIGCWLKIKCFLFMNYERITREPEEKACTVSHQSVIISGRILPLFRQRDRTRQNMSEHVVVRESPWEEEKEGELKRVQKCLVLERLRATKAVNLWFNITLVCSDHFCGSEDITKCEKSLSFFPIRLRLLCI